MECRTRGAEVVEKVFLDKVSILLSLLRCRKNRQNTLAWTRTTRSGARSLLVDSVACGEAVRVLGNVEGEGGDAEAAARRRSAMVQSRRGAEVIAKVLLDKVAILFSLLRRGRSRRNTLAWTRTTRSFSHS